MHVEIVHGDILLQKADALVLPCNGMGIMGFMSLAGEVRRFMGRELYLTYKSLCPMEVGDVHLIDAPPGAHQQRVLLACTMIAPGTPIPTSYVTRTAREILALAKAKDIQSLAWPLLGAGGGRVEATRAFLAMMEEIEQAGRDGYTPHITIVEKSHHKYNALQNDAAVQRALA